MARVYHSLFDLDPDSDAFETARDLRMGYDWCEQTDTHPVDHTDLYRHAGTVDADDPSEAYTRWEVGDGHDPTETRSMAVGDIILVDRTAYYVDTIGFVEVDVEIAPDGQLEASGA